MSETLQRPTDETFAARVADGIKLLDEQYPTWWQDINLRTLDVASGTTCVTAQSFRILNPDADDYDSSYWIQGGEMFGLNPQGGDGEDVTDYILHGFNAEGASLAYDHHAEFNQETGEYPYNPGWEGYSYFDAIETLNNLWKGEILKRREAAPADITT